MSERVWSEAEIAAFKATEPQLAARGMYVEGPKGEANGKQFMRWFDLNPQEPVTVAKLLWLFEEFRNIPNGIFRKSDAQMKFENTSAHLAPHDLDTLEKFLKANRLWPDDDGAYLNACLFISVMMGRPYTHDVLAHWALPLVRNSGGDGLRWKTPGRESAYRLTGKHSGGDSHFMPRSETNLGPGFSGRVDHAAQARDNSAAVAQKIIDRSGEHFLAASRALQGSRHSITAEIRKSVEAAIVEGKTPLEVYEIGKQTQRRLQIESERGR